MLGKMALQFSAALSNTGIFESDDVPVYAYGFELVMATILNILAVILISVIFGKPLAWLFFLLSFIPLRTMAGGYHANTHLACFAVFCIAYSVLLAVPAYLEGFTSPYVTMANTSVCFIVTALLAPIPSDNKPISAAQRIDNRRKSIVYSGICVALCAISFCAGERFRFVLSVFAMGQFGASVSLIIAWVINKRSSKRAKPVMLSGTPE